MNTLKCVWIALVLLTMSGCASLTGQPNYADLSAAQANAAVRDKSATVVCTKIMAAGYSLESATIGLDQNAIKDGGVSVDNSKGCVATITSAAPPKAAPK